MVRLSDEESATEATFTVSGSQELLVAIDQQLSWMTASFRIPKYDQVSYSDALLLSKDIGIFYVVSIPLQSIEAEHDVCWLHLLYRTVIAPNYPISGRRQEKGLELPLHLMTTLAGSLQPMLYDGGMILKDYLRLLFPSSDSEPNTLQWHLVTSSNRRDALPENTIHSYQWLRVRSPKQLASKRNFLGYCGHAVVELGTEMPVDHYRHITFSSAEYESHEPSFQDPSSIIYGSSGMRIFGMSVTHPIQASLKTQIINSR
jgi:hypothetical protein